VNSRNLRHLGVPATTFHEVYRRGAPWDIGIPQPLVIQLAQYGQIRGRVLDVGCGYGDNALFLTQQGHSVCAIDFVQTAIAHCQVRAKRSNVGVHFLCCDIFELSQQAPAFQTVLDIGTFHSFSDEQRIAYAGYLASCAAIGSKLHLLCFSEREQRPGGPRRVTLDEVRTTFRDYWRLARAIETAYVNREYNGGAAAWAIELVRI
jgi:SAM-dependent methyltransferase